MSRAANMRMGTTPGLPEGTRALKSSSHNSKSSEIVLNQLSGPPPKKGGSAATLGEFFVIKQTEFNLQKAKGKLKNSEIFFFWGGLQKFEEKTTSMTVG